MIFHHRFPRHGILRRETGIMKSQNITEHPSGGGDLAGGHSTHLLPWPKPKILCLSLYNCWAPGKTQCSFAALGASSVFFPLFIYPSLCTAPGPGVLGMVEHSDSGDLFWFKDTVSQGPVQIPGEGVSCCSSCFPVQAAFGHIHTVLLATTSLWKKAGYALQTALASGVGVSHCLTWCCLVSCCSRKMCPLSSGLPGGSHGRSTAVSWEHCSSGSLEQAPSWFMKAYDLVQGFQGHFRMQRKSLDSRKRGLTCTCGTLVPYSSAVSGCTSFIPVSIWTHQESSCVFLF